MIAYHVDRLSVLHEHAILQLFKFNDIESRFNEHLENIYPEGVSRHGDGYFASIYNVSRHKDGLCNGPNEYLIESILEYERRLNFSNKISRYQSVFAAKSLDDLMLWNDALGISTSIIWEIEFITEYIECDAGWFNKFGSFESELSLLEASYFAHKYWNGEVCTENSKPELLIKPPVIINRKITL